MNNKALIACKRSNLITICLIYVQLVDVYLVIYRDALSHTAKRLPEAHQLELLRNVTDLLKRTFSSQFVFPALGHDDPATLKRHLGELWRRWLPPDSMPTFEKGNINILLNHNVIVSTLHYSTKLRNNKLFIRRVVFDIFYN